MVVLSVGGLVLVVYEVETINSRCRRSSMRGETVGLAVRQQGRGRATDEARGGEAQRCDNGTRGSR
jgi:hypothetical protein